MSPKFKGSTWQDIGFYFCSGSFLLVEPSACRCQSCTCYLEQAFCNTTSNFSQHIQEETENSFALLVTVFSSAVFLSISAPYKSIYNYYLYWFKFAVLTWRFVGNTAPLLKFSKAVLFFCTSSSDKCSLL